MTTVTCQTVSAAVQSTNRLVLSSGATVYSPVNVTYNTRFLALNLTVGQGLGIKYSLTYSVDGTYVGDVPLTALKPNELHVVNPTAGYVLLPELSEGTHNLTLKVTASITTSSPNPPGPPFKPTTPGGPYYQADWQDTITFTIDTHAQPPDLTSPTITAVSTENQTFQTADVPLNFRVNEPISHATYSLNGTDEVTIYGNTTLESLQPGQYILLLNVWDTAGNLGTEISRFNVTEPAPEPTADFPALTVIAVSVSLFCLIVAIVVLKKKRKRCLD